MDSEDYTPNRARSLFHYLSIEERSQLQAQDTQAQSRYTLPYLHNGNLPDAVSPSHECSVETLARMPSLETVGIGMASFMGIFRFIQPTCNLRSFLGAITGCSSHTIVTLCFGRCSVEIVFCASRQSHPVSFI